MYAPGAPQVDPALFEAGVPVVRHLLRLPGDGAVRSAATSRHTGSREYGRTAVDGHRRPARCWPTLPDRQHGLDVATATRSPRRPPGFDVLASTAGRAGGGVRGRSTAGSPACSGTPR
ncbi:MAG: hypothetical protein WKF47_14895 [Geodermatophilaceae bacterium]